MCTGFWYGKYRERVHWGDPDVDGRIILRWMEGRVMHMVLVGKPQGKSPLGRPRRRWEYNTKMDGGQRFVEGSGRET
jgi:hypothetical protein